ncbi:hypothetical protein JYT16_01020 [Gemmatimonas aurantiaca]|nr:hypothetical protein [Gemmatimonas aurantiaca]
MSKILTSGCCVMHIVCFVCSPIVGFEIKTDRGLALGGATLMAHPTASDIIATPGIWLGSDEVFISAALQRRFNLRELDNATFASVYIYRNVTFGLGLQQFGRSDYYAEKTLRLSLGYQNGDYKIATVYSARELEFGGPDYPSLSAGAFGFSLGINTKYALLSLLADNLNSPSFTELSPRAKKFVEMQIQPKSESMISAIVRLRARENDKPQFALGQMLQLTESVRLLWGLENRPLQYGSGLEIRYTNVTIIYGGRFHPDLGYTHQASLAYSFGKQSPNRENQ